MEIIVQVLQTDKRGTAASAATYNRYIDHESNKKLTHFNFHTKALVSIL